MSAELRERLRAALNSRQSGRLGPGRRLVICRRRQALLNPRGCGSPFFHLDLLFGFFLAGDSLSEDWAEDPLAFEEPAAPRGFEALDDTSDDATDDAREW